MWVVCIVQYMYVQTVCAVMMIGLITTYSFITHYSIVLYLVQYNTLHRKVELSGTM